MKYLDELIKEVEEILRQAKSGTIDSREAKVCIGTVSELIK